MLPCSILLFSSAAVIGVFSSRTKRYRIFIIMGALMMTFGFASLIHLSEKSGRLEQIFLQIIASIGAGFIFAPRILATQAAQQLKDIPAAAATMTFFFNLGQCFALPVGAVTYESMWDKLVNKNVKAGIIPPKLIISSHEAEESGEIISKFPKEIAELYQHIMAFSISRIWIVITVLCAVIVMLALIMKEVPLSGGGAEIEKRTKRRARKEDANDAEKLIPGGGVGH
jgi:hypothetical protein